MEKLIALAILATGGFYILSRKENPRAFGTTGVPYKPSLGAFDTTGGVPLSIAEMDRRAALKLDDGTSRLDLGWLTAGWLDSEQTKDEGAADYLSDDWSIFDMAEPRGIRNNNPGNIEYTGTQWQGLDTPPSDGRFMRFTDPLYGIRAMARVLGTYSTSYGLDNIGGIIQRWAPSHENNSAVYAGFVADKLGVRATDRINVMDSRPELVAAMIEFENGDQPYSMDMIRQGVGMA